MTDHLVLDIEIQRTIEDTPGGWDATHLLGVSVAVVYEMEADRYTIYGPDDVPALQSRLEAADRITTWNGDTFDLLVIYGVPRPGVVTHLAAVSDDLLARVWRALGRREKGWKLGDVAQAMLGRSKTGNGADTPRLFQTGRWIELINYCLEDVRILRDVCRHLDTTGQVSNGWKVITLPPWRP